MGEVVAWRGRARSSRQRGATERGLPHPPLLGERQVSILGDDDVVEDFEATERADLPKSLGEIEVHTRGRRVPARVVVGDDEGRGTIADGTTENLARMHVDAGQTADGDDPAFDEAVTYVKIEDDEVFAVGGANVLELVKDVARARDPWAAGLIGGLAVGRVVLLCHERPQEGQHGSLRASARAMRDRIVAMEAGLWRSGRTGTSPRAETCG